MNLRLVSKLLGVIAFLTGGTMLLSLPWAHPSMGVRQHLELSADLKFETRGFLALLGSFFVCLLVGAVFYRFGRPADKRLYRKEAMAVVGLSWVLATVLGALPFYFAGTYLHAHAPMTFIDCLFESQSGFSTTGATVISQLEDPNLVPHCILFWRSSTHFLGGLGIIVMFVVILGQGSAGKALMRAEMPGPTMEGSMSRMQHTAWLFGGIYLGLNLVLAVLLKMMGMTLFDALCHSFGTMATGGFSTYNASLGHFDRADIEYVVLGFMILAGTNFTLLYFILIRQPKRLLADVEWRSYMGSIGLVTLLVIGFGLVYGDFDGIFSSLRYGLFQVVSIMTTTGYGTHDFDQWNSFGRGVLFLLMFVGGCAGSTGGGMKVIRHVLFLKILGLELEQAYHPTVVRPLRLGGRLVDDSGLRTSILVYFGLVLVIFVFSWMLLVTTEPDSTWSGAVEHKLIDSASGVAATLNNIGPGLGTVGATQNYGHFSWHSKLLFVLLMMLGRLEIFPILVLFLPSFWRIR
jgi:trk system potassium uptake protein TrkH